MKGSKKIIASMVMASIVTSNITVLAKDTSEKNNVEYSKESIINNIEEEELFDKNRGTIKSDKLSLDKFTGKKNILEKKRNINLYKESKHTADKAIEINTDFVYSDSLLNTGDINWYKINSKNFKKLTTYIQFSGNMDFSTEIYKSTDGTSKNLELVEQSQWNLFTNFEQLSYTTKGEWYYIAIKSNSSSGNYAFTTSGSLTNVSKYEPNDNFRQANTYIDSIGIKETIDNPYDEDWSKISVTKDTVFNISFNVPTGSNLALNIWSSNFSAGSTIEKIQSGTYNIQLAKGDYYFRVSGTTNTVADEYEMYVSPKESVVTKVNVEKIESSKNGSDNRINYGYGDFWRVYKDVTIKGTAYNSSGRVAPNTKVSVAIQTKLGGGKIVKASTFTDEFGKFKIIINDLDPAIGEYVYNNGRSMHYYDIIPMLFANNTEWINSSDELLYHFAYSM